MASLSTGCCCSALMFLSFFLSVVSCLAAQGRKEVLLFMYLMWKVELGTEEKEKELGAVIYKCHWWWGPLTTWWATHVANDWVQRWTGSVHVIAGREQLKLSIGSWISAKKQLFFRSSFSPSNLSGPFLNTSLYSRLQWIELPLPKGQNTKSVEKDRRGTEMCLEVLLSESISLVLHRTEHPICKKSWERRRGITWH